MKRYIAVILLCIIPVYTVAVTRLAPSEPARPAPPLRLHDLSGKTVSIDDLKGKVLLVNFWASWCPPCREEMPSLWRLYKKIDHPGFRVVLVNMGETKETITEFLPEKIQRDLLILADPANSSASAWKVDTLPQSFIVDSNGRLRYEYRGARPWDHGDYIIKVNNLLGN